MNDMSTDAKKQIFNFTLGPVQGFVAQARRTRDFWAGSFLLSWLVGIAMCEVEAQQGKILFPKMDDNYKKAINSSEGKPSEYAQQGGIPNRFKAEVPAEFKPEDVVKAVQIAWSTLAHKVWIGDLEKIAISFKKDGVDIPKTKRLWDQQVGSFWEMNWIISDDASDNSLVDRRKNWRVHLPPPQSGGKCALMAGWQELSATWTGEDRKEYWHKLRDKTGDLDLGEDEYLCAIAFIKRRFHKYFQCIKNEPMPSNWLANGWEIDKTAQSVPSVTYIAAAPWLAKVMQNSETNLLRNLAECGEWLAGYKGQGERNSPIYCIQDMLKKHTDIPASLACLDGAVFFPDLYGSHYKEASERNKNAMRHAIKNLDASQPSPFYAVLLMDGDSLGKLLGSADREKGVTAALNNFCEKVPAVVKELSGFLIYAGGDDVLALLPLENALECARQVREKYRESFENQTKENDIPLDMKEAFEKATISAAIQYVHVHCPLTRILHDAHHLLDDIAKDGCGRDAVAVRVVKTGGTVLEWAQPWDIALTEEKSIIVNELVPKDASQVMFSSKFLYGLRELFDRFEGVDELNEQEMQKIVLSDYQSSGLCPTDDGKPETKQKIETAQSELNRLLQQCQPYKRDSEGKAQPKNNTKTADAALLIRFLASKGLNI